MPRTAGIEVDAEKKVLIASERDRPDVADQRTKWFARQTGMDPSRLVFIDETWVKTNMTRPRGERLLDKVPHGHWKTTTFLTALRCTGLTAPLVIDGGINGPLFLSWVKQELLPTLQEGDIVVMDNLSSHKVAGVRETIATAGAGVLFLPPYSPDLNPIETVFSKFKWIIRSLKERTVDALWNACGKVSELFPEDECRRHFRHCGYRYT